MKNLFSATDRIVMFVLLVGAVLSLIFMSSMVAPPRILMGRALSAIPPSLFPAMVLVAMAILCALFLFGALRTGHGEAENNFSDGAAVKRGVLLFAIMILYALTMEPIGFLFSSMITLVLLSLLTGNRSVLQIGILSVAGPIILYLVATRVLAVSLPELDAIEIFYARIPGL